jgi:release factor glutamine methyltransferase
MAPTMSAQTLLAEAATALLAVGISNGRQEAGWLLARVLEQEPLSAQPCSGGTPLTMTTLAQFQELLARRLAGEPLQYILGDVDFHCVNLLVGPGVLIPRPETEQLVEFALALYPGSGAICDLCTGSGAIALALAASLPQAAVSAVELSPKALQWARRNAQRLELTRVEFFQGDLFAPLPPGARFALITANPPYVAADEYERLDAVVKDYEPAMALLAAERGLALIRRIAEEARQWLLPGACLLCEIGEEQGRRVGDILSSCGYTEVAIRQDYAGKDRVAVAQWPHKASSADEQK